MCGNRLYYFQLPISSIEEEEEEEEEEENRWPYFGKIKSVILRLAVIELATREISIYILLNIHAMTK